MGVWIEITFAPCFRKNAMVTPLVGVWIEILSLQVLYAFPSSLPLWECGLKYGIGVDNKTVSRSLPLWECGLK